MLEQVADLARAAAEAAKPKLEQAVDFARDHEDELKRAGQTAARTALSHSVPPILRPIAADLVDELTNEDSALDGEGSEDSTGKQEPASPP